MWHGVVVDVCGGTPTAHIGDVWRQIAGVLHQLGPEPRPRSGLGRNAEDQHQPEDHGRGPPHTVVAPPHVCKFVDPRGIVYRRVVL